MFSGSLCALVTPFKDGRIDEQRFQSFIEWQIDQGTHGLVPCGTTGESPTLSHEEHQRVIELCVEVVKGRVPVIAGTGSNATDEAIMLTRHAKTAGADAALIVAPYYNKPTDEGVYQHFKHIHDAVGLPLILYNIPSRCGIEISLAVTERLAALPYVIGIKDATRDLLRPLMTRHVLGSSFCQLCGEDAMVVAFLAQGGHGCISVLANVAPRLCAELHNAWRHNDYPTVFMIRDRLVPLVNALVVESNPGPVKYAVHLLDRCAAELRLPMVMPSEPNKQLIRTAMSQIGLLPSGLE